MDSPKGINALVSAALVLSLGEVVLFFPQHAKGQVASCVLDGAVSVIYLHTEPQRTQLLLPGATKFGQNIP